MIDTTTYIGREIILSGARCAITGVQIKRGKTMLRVALPPTKCRPEGGFSLVDAATAEFADAARFREPVSMDDLCRQHRADNRARRDGRMTGWESDKARGR